MKERSQAKNWTKFGCNLLTSPLFSLSLYRQKKTVRLCILKYLLGYPGLLKLIIILNFVTICITHARQTKRCKLIKWYKMAQLEWSHNSLLTISGSGWYLSFIYKTV